MKVTLYYDPICKTFSTENELLDCHDEDPSFGVAVDVEVEPPVWPPPLDEVLDD